MKKRLLFVLLATTLFSTPSFASVFMLQFGSFETDAEAQAKLQDLNAKHGASLGGMRTSIRSISLPPDNLTVYRTQAGPVNTREQAQSVCSQFAASGDECYVVETAMVDQGTPVGTQPSSMRPVASTPAAPATTTTTVTTTTVSPAPLMASEVAPSGRDAQSRAAIASVTQEPAPSVEVATPAPMPMMAAAPVAISPQPLVNPSVSVAASSPMEAELASAAAQQQAAMNASPQQAQPAHAEASTLHSVWWHLNPFTDEEAAIDARTNAARPAPATAAPMAAPVVAVQVTAPPPPAPMLTPLPASTVTVVPPAPVVMTPPPVSAMQLPPPPAPLRAEDRAALAAGQIPPSAAIAPQPTGVLPVIAPPVTVAAAPAAPASPTIVVAPFKASPSVPPGGGETLAEIPGNVRVGEAKRVPLSAQIVPPPPSVASVPGPVTTAPAMASMAAPGVSLHPSATLGEKSIWAQIGRFQDAQAALAFWDGYRRAHPDFPVVRVRVTSPYQLQARGATEVSLRVGPFARAEFVNHLCATMPEDGALRCGLVSDLGVAADPAGHSGYLPDSRYHRTAQGTR